MNIQTKVDKLGDLKAKIKALQDQEEKLEVELKRTGKKIIEGKKYRCSISYKVVRKTVAWQTIAKKFKPSAQLVRANTKKSSSDRVKVSAHKK